MLRIDSSALRDGLNLKPPVEVKNRQQDGMVMSLKHLFGA